MWFATNINTQTTQTQLESSSSEIPTMFKPCKHFSFVCGLVLWSGCANRLLNQASQIKLGALLMQLLQLAKCSVLNSCRRLLDSGCGSSLDFASELCFYTRSTERCRGVPVARRLTMT